MSTASAPGKIILAGEYAVVFGYPGLAIPSSTGLTATWESADGDLKIDWPGIDARWIDYLRRIVRACERIAGSPFGEVLRIENDLPLGRGMGSSTALVIAVSRCLLGSDRETDARLVEDTVNPGHSGLDFAVIWNNRGLRFEKNKEPTAVDRERIDVPNALLIDTGKPNETTAELVAWLTERKKRETPIQEALATIGACADRLLGGESPLAVFPGHHRAQMSLGVVPADTAGLIAAIERSGGAAKVIGAGARSGGGGMVLAVHPEGEILTNLIGSTSFSFIPLWRR